MDRSRPLALGHRSDTVPWSREVVTQVRCALGRGTPMATQASMGLAHISPETPSLAADPPCLLHFGVCVSPGPGLMVDDALRPGMARVNSAQLSPVTPGYPPSSWTPRIPSQFPSSPPGTRPQLLLV